MTTPTPETDAEVVRINYGHDMVTGDFARKLELQRDALAAALRELSALVRGECPSLLNEDSGGNARLDMEIDAALAMLKEKS